MLNLIRILLALWITALPVCSSAAGVDPDPKRLARGEFVWHPEIAPAGPVVVIVSLDEQRAYVYRNGIAIGISTISSGRKGHETPPGVFTILQKQVEHYSDKYDNAPMPFMERLTWDGVAMHGGNLPGYPASHGCVRLPQAFARKLYEITTRGVTVVVANGKSAPATVVHPATLAPISANGEQIGSGPPSLDYTWHDVSETPGPISILVSTADHAIFVFHNGNLTATTHFTNDASGIVRGSVLYVMGVGVDYVPSTLDPSRPKHQWTAYPLPTRSDPNPHVDAPSAFHVPPEFARRVYDILVPGTTVLVTDLPAVRPQIDNKPMRVLESDSIRTHPAR
jgi:hypothetical protein